MNQRLEVLKVELESKQQSAQHKRDRMHSVNSMMIQRKHNEDVIRFEDRQKNVQRNKLVRKYQIEEFWKKKVEKLNLIGRFKKK